MPNSRRIGISRQGRALEGVLTLPRETPDGGAVLCHPHPQYGGTMDNPVILAVAQALVADGLATIRFNFGGVDTSQRSDGGEAVEDTRAALAALRSAVPDSTPLTLAGYSFGAWIALLAAADAPDVKHVIAIAPPLDYFECDLFASLPQGVSLIAAEHDQFCNAEHLARLADLYPDRVAVVATLPGADHFFWGMEDQVADACRLAIRSHRGA